MPFQLKRNTIKDFHNKTIECYADRDSLYFVDESPITYKEYDNKVVALRKKLLESGLKKGDRVALLGQASPNWAISYMAVMSAGLVSVPIMEDFPITDINHIIQDSAARCCLIDPAIQKRGELDSLENILLLSLNDFSEMQKLSLPYNREDAEIFLSKPDSYNMIPGEDYSFECASTDVAELLYTSGTTGYSKAVLLTHNNLVTNLYEGTDLIDVCFDENSILMSLLPMAHAYGSTSAYLSIVYKGSRICFLKRKPTPEYLQRVFASIRPTILGGVPLIFEKIYQKKILPIINSNKASKFLISIPLFRKIFYRIVGKSILKYFGGQLKCIIIGGANFSSTVETFMNEAKIPYVLGYGLTETSPLLTFSSLSEARFGSVGKAVSDTSLRITNKDEKGIGDIEATGPQIMKGYYRKPEETAAVFTDDGWFKTGDRGFVDSEGYLFIKGRSKNVIIGNSGENIYPEVIETLLGGYPDIEESLVLQKDHKLQALLYLGESEITEDKLENIRIELNKRLPSASRIHHFIIQKEPFIKTPTRKIKRTFYVEDY
ncbi:MAG: hypothetical protein B6241_06875 [Spirochaetaceae bacterium 4572_59]|nr:MAG: hypothetical protein B6241_06875 [Spirochaetaceae bacterium 4572_59]